MQVTATIVLDNDDNFAYTPEAAAGQILAALGGNPTSDYVWVSVQQHAGGAAGEPPNTIEEPPAP